MPVPIEEVSAKMDGGVPSLPDIYSLLIEKYFDHASCAAVAQSGMLDGFSPSCNTSRRWDKSFFINEQCYYFTRTSWSLFTQQHITLDSIKIFNINHVYWLPGELLFDTILNMPNLEELSIKGTQVCTVWQVTKILNSCQKITKLDFTFKEKTQVELTDGLKDSEKGGYLSLGCYQKLTSLKLSTTVTGPDPDLDKDPWVVIVSILTCCRDCTDLNVEVTYAGQTFQEILGQYDFKEKVIPWLDGMTTKLSWMESLKSLVFLKLGPNAKFAGERVISHVLSALLRNFLFPRREEDEPPSPLRRLWIQNFEIPYCAALRNSNSDSLQSYRSGACGKLEDEVFESFPNMEHLAGNMGVTFSHPLPSLVKLKYASGTSTDDGKFFKFCEAHPELEDLSVELWYSAPELANDALCKLPKLKSFSCRRLISKEYVEAMTEAYPIVEDIRLTMYRHRTIPPDHGPILSAFRFPHLTSLSLSNFQLLDGAALLPIIKGCPKLESVHLDTDALDAVSFPSNLELFLRSAIKLRDFRLVIEHKEDAYPSTAFSILKALLKGSPLLERVALIDGGSEKLTDWEHPPEFADFLIGFTAKMTLLNCCCLTFNQLDVDFMKEVKNRVEEEVVTERPSLWFHLDRSLPEASDEGVPSIHYHQMVEPISFLMPRI